ncbi:error-prone DNA polymerase [Rhodoblastus sp.]|uniref:error-prone DNA polymerase n=1 Tax=Rhodoblastus sp. TaxID=1962975 RepID=UPI003F9B96BF
MSYAELVCASHYSFLRGASPPADLIRTALQLDYPGLGLCDRNSLAGVVRALSALEDFAQAPDDELAQRAKNFRLLAGARVSFCDGAPDVVVYPANRAGWGRLCRLLTLGKRRAKKGDCLLRLEDLLAETEDLLLILLPTQKPEALEKPLARLHAACPGAIWLGANMPRGGRDRRRLQELRRLAQAQGVKLLAQNDALYSVPEDCALQDVLCCVREHMTLAQAGRRLEVNAERHLKSPREMARLFADAPEAIQEISMFFSRVKFHLRELSYEYPDEPTPRGWTSQAWLEELTRRALPQRYPQGAPPKVRALIVKELALIAKLDYAPYFLTIHDIVDFARKKEILCQGRGSAANSAVCYVLGITAVDPAENDLLFARFISAARREPPDIDVDFEHERREEVIQHIYEKYGREHAGLAAAVISYRPRSALRDVAKVFGLSEDMIVALGSLQWGSHGDGFSRKHIAQAGLDPANPTIRQVIFFARRILGFPRHLSQHVGGFVLTRGRLDELVPIGNAAMPDRTFLEWDKDDIAALGLMKVDILALGMLTCICKGFELLARHEGLEIGLAEVPREDRAVYDMLCKGDSVGVFQVESRAQMNMLPHLRPRKFYDLVIEVAIVRPGPIQGDMVHPYLRRRAGHEQVSFPSPAPEHGPRDELHRVLGKTLGVPLFQEQAMSLAMVAAKFSEEEANRLRRAMATFRHLGTIGEFESMMVSRMCARGYEREFAQRCFEQIKGFGSYGFPESHAASFAHLVYVSAWLKCRHPAVFACALLNAQPMGFYAPAQIVRDAREHGVEILPVDVNHSSWDNTLERKDDALALRLGFRQIGGLTQSELERLIAVRGEGFATLESCATRAELCARTLKILADADAFRSCRVLTVSCDPAPEKKLDRRAALWAARRLPGTKPLPLFAAAGIEELGVEPDPALPLLRLGEQVVADYQTLRLSLAAHPMQLLRPLFASENFVRACDLAACRDGAWKKAAGLVLVRQRPGNGKMIFVTLEDETGVVNVALYSTLFERYRKETMAARLMAVEGRVQKSWAGVVHLLGQRVSDRSAELGRLSESATGRADRAHHPRNVRVIPQSRDFH